MAEKSPNLKAIGERVRYWRKEVRGLTLQKVADQIGSSHGALAKLETGDAGMSLERLERLASALNLPVGFIADPKMPYAPVFGRVTGSGVWKKHPEPLFDKAGIYPLILPFERDVENAVAFEDAQNFLICTAVNDAPIADDLYLVLRSAMAENLDLTDPETPPSASFSEMTVRTFRQEKADPSPPQNALDAAGRHVRRVGWFESGEGPDGDRFVTRHNSSIVRVWRVVGGLKIDA
jgi:transcriptional regulator with XRE-family HTH domain